MSKSMDVEQGSVEAIPPQQALGRTHYKPRPSTLGNPGVLGLFSFASTTFVLSLYNIQTRSILHPNVVVGMALFAGGLSQILAGMWEFPRGNTFGGTGEYEFAFARGSRDVDLLPETEMRWSLCGCTATAQISCGREPRFMVDGGAGIWPWRKFFHWKSGPFTTYGAFWMSYATILIPGSGILAAYTSKTELQSALGIFLICWAMITACYFVVSFGKNIAFIALFGLLTTTFVVLAAGEFTANASVTKAGGVIGVVVAFIAWYIGLSELLAAEAHPVFTLPIGILHPVKND
ncbi:hypothetical protein H0H81_011706 [Sphagnurus paluster]|uniref:Uncharacterized protein n=1 Tax=Sphagnurus paluster TaxID=117069 RepID=A0A9P7FUF3_9AGAR|nr:hypothetical protein H0H81_011706 [Sphagnurus paluster]